MPWGYMYATTYMAVGQSCPGTFSHKIHHHYELTCRFGSTIHSRIIQVLRISVLIGGFFTVYHNKITEALHNDNTMKCMRMVVLQFMEQEGARHLMQFWMAADNFQQQLIQQEGTYDGMQAQSDAMILYDRWVFSSAVIL